MHNFYSLFKQALISLLVVLLVIEPAVANETVTYIHNDIAGSPISATDSAGNLLWRESYRPYGERVLNQAAAANSDQWFHGKEQDDTGLQYFGARYYDSQVGRFMGVDPVGFDAADIHSFNRYAYGNNNPYRYLDSDGRAAGSITLRAAVVVVPKRYLAAIGLSGGIIAANDPAFVANVQKTQDAYRKFWKDSIFSDSEGSNREGASSADGKNSEGNNEVNPSASGGEKNLGKVKERDGNKIAQGAGYRDAHDAKKGRGEGGVDIYRDRTPADIGCGMAQKGGEEAL